MFNIITFLIYKVEGGKNMINCDLMEKVKNLSLKQILILLQAEEKPVVIENINSEIVYGTKLYIPLKLEIKFLENQISKQKRFYIKVKTTINYKRKLIVVEITFPKMGIIDVEKVFGTLSFNSKEKPEEYNVDSPKLVFTKEFTTDEKELEVHIKDTIYNYISELIVSYVVPFMCILEKETKMANEFASLFNKKLFTE